MIERLKLLGLAFALAVGVVSAVLGLLWLGFVGAVYLSAAQFIGIAVIGLTAYIYFGVLGD